MQMDQTDQLFTALADQLKIPLLQIARMAETAPELVRIQAIADHALRLVDAYVRTRTANQIELLLEPITSSAVLYDVAVTLQPFAYQYDVSIEVDQQGRGVPIMANREALSTMLTLLGAGLIEATTESDADKRLVLGTHQSAKGVIVGAFSSHVEISQQALTLTRQLHGRAAQAVPALGQAGGAGLAIADRLSEHMEAPLRAYRHRSMMGIGSLLIPSKQLQLIS